MVFDVCDALGIVHGAIDKLVLATHAVFGDKQLLVIGIAQRNIHHKVEQALGIDDPIPVRGGNAGTYGALAHARHAPATGALVACAVVMKVGLTFERLEKTALVIVDAQAVVELRGAAHNREVIVQKLD